MGRLIVHIGLPKSGTTSLQQDVFPKLKCCYLGVNQPRERAQHGLYTRIIEYSKCAPTEECIREIRAELRELIKYSDVLLSDEMFTVDQNNARWQDKLKRLSVLFEGLDTEILVTLREPVSAAKSYFVELCSQNRGYCAMAAHDFILNSNEAKIYQYDLLMSELKRNFRNTPISLFAFEDIVVNKNIQRLLDSLGLKEECAITLENRNTKLESKSGYEFVSQNKFAKLLSKMEFKKGTLIRSIADYLIKKNTEITIFNPNLNQKEKILVESVLSKGDRVRLQCLGG
jgi:hypothetical protein